jgi:hypothetical protein
VADDFGGFSPQRPGFNRKAIHAECVVEKMTVRQYDRSHQPNSILSVLHSRVSEQRKLASNTSSLTLLTTPTASPHLMDNLIYY